MAVVGVVAALAILAGLSAIFARGSGGTEETVLAAEAPETTASSPETNTASSTATSTPASSTPTTSTPTTLTPATAASVAAQPLALPLTGPDISNLLGIPLDPDGVDPLLGPANAPQVCDIAPDITGLSDTLAGVYPRDSTTDGSFRSVAQRMHRFATPEQAMAFIASYVEIPCERWEDVITSDGEPSIMTAALAPPTRTVGDEISQIDITTTLPTGVQIYSRTVLVRQGSDVFKLYFATIEAAGLAASTDTLLDAAVEILGY